MRIGTILESKKIVIMTTGSAKADAVKRMIEGPVAAICPASALQLYNDATCIVDSQAANLRRKGIVDHRIEIDKPAFEQRLGHGLKGFVHPSVEFDFVVLLFRSSDRACLYGYDRVL